MPKRTQIVCLHEGNRGSTDIVFINRLLKQLDPIWLRPATSSTVQFVPCGGRANVLGKFTRELRACLGQGGDTTLMVWADLDHDMKNGDALLEIFRLEGQKQGITKEQFDKVVFVFAKDRIENWIQFLNTGVTDESIEGPRVKNELTVKAAKTLAKMCLENSSMVRPPSLEWSCNNWKILEKRMKD